MRDIRKVGMKYGKRCCAATAAEHHICWSRVIRQQQQTGWKRPTEASPGGEWGMDARKVESTRVAGKNAKNRPRRGYNSNDLCKIKGQNSVKVSATSRSLKWLKGVGWAGLLCENKPINPCPFLISFYPPPSHPHPWHPSSIALFSETDRTRDACES